MIDILREIQEKLMNIEVCIDELKDKILEKDEELEDLKEQVSIKENASWETTPER